MDKCVEKDYSIYDKNMTLFKDLSPSIHSILSRSGEEACQDFEVLNTNNNLINIKVSGNSGKFLLHSNYNPYAESAKMDIFSKDDGIDTIVILGLGLGYHLEYLINKYPEKNKIIIEPGIEFLKSCIGLRDFSEILKAKNTELILSSNPKEVAYQLINFYDSKIINKLEFISLTSYHLQYKAYWQELQEKYVELLRDQVINMNTSQLFKFTWTRNILKNIRHLANSSTIQDYVDKFKSVPGIIVSSGPSLNKNVHLLKNLKGKAIIIAAGTAVNPLISAGVIPDIMLGIDGGPAMSRTYKNLDRDDIILAYSLNLHYDCIENHKGTKLFFRTHSELKANYIDEKFNLKTPGFYSGPSCANEATEFLYYMGCDPIIFVGQDLCYEGVRTHADGTLGKKDIDDADKIKQNTRIYTTALDMNNNTVTTMYALLSMKDWFERYFAVRNGARTFINATASGLPLEGAIHMNLEEVIEKYCSRDLQTEERLKEIYKKSMELKKYSEADMDKFLTFLNKEAQKSIRQSKRRMKLLNKILEDIDNGDLSNINDKREKINKITEKFEESDFFKYFLNIGSCDVNHAIKNTVETEALKEKDLFKKLKILYDGLSKQYAEIHLRAEYVDAFFKGQIID